MIGGLDNTMQTSKTPRRARPIGLHVLLVMVVALGSAGCGEDFEPAWRVNDYRLLALQASPPVLQQGESATLRAVDYNPDDRDVTYTWEWCPFQTSAQNEFKCPEFDPSDLTGSSERALRQTQSALHTDAGVAHSDAGPPDASARDATSNDTSGAADVRPADSSSADAATDTFSDTQTTEREDAQDAGSQSPFPPSGEDPFALGTGREIQFSYPGSEAQILAVCQAIQRAVARAGQDSPLSGRLSTADCSRGYKISVRVVIDTGQRELVARKNIELSTGSDQINQNPQLGGIDIRPAKPADISRLRDSLDWVIPADTPRRQQWVEMPADEPLPLAADTSFDLRAVVDRNDIESWRPPAPEGSDRQELPPRLEIWQFKWYTTLGDLADSERLYDPDLNTLEEATRSGLTVHSDQLDGSCAASTQTDTCVGHIWQIVRDGRLGLDWVKRSVSIQNASQ
jgi:hypothetical protein